MSKNKANPNYVEPTHVARVTGRVDRLEAEVMKAAGATMSGQRVATEIDCEHTGDNVTTVYCAEVEMYRILHAMPQMVRSYGHSPNGGSYYVTIVWGMR